MLIYKAWLETRWRFVFILAVTALSEFAFMALGLPSTRVWQGMRLTAPLLNCFAALYLAGAGLNTQTTYSAVTGFHGSMLFTLSLPVSRRRLLFVRAGVGALETCVFVVLSEALTLAWNPAPFSLTQALIYLTRTLITTMVIYTFSVLLACFLDEMWQFTGAVMILSTAWLVQIRFAPLAQFSPFNAMSLVSMPLTVPMPWIPLLISTVFAALLISASAVVLERKEY